MDADARRRVEVHMIHHADDIRECSATYGGPNYVEQDGQDGQCRYAPHWSRCHCADAVDQAVKEEREHLIGVATRYRWMPADQFVEALRMEPTAAEVRDGR